jgi:hypothetical protein
MVNIRSKDSFSWTGKSSNYTDKKDFIPTSRIISDIRSLQKLIAMSTNSFKREDFQELKKDILYLKNEITKNITGRDVPSNISRDYEYLMKDVEERIIEIDKEILG